MTDASPNARSRRTSRSLTRLLESSAAAFWVLDATGRLAHLSPAMRSRIGDQADGWIGQNVLEADAKLGPSACGFLASMAPPGELGERGHATGKVSLPQPGRAEPTQPQNAHFVCFGDAGEGDSAIVVGCLGDFVSDADIAVERWIAAGGIRHTAQVREQLNRQRAAGQHSAEITLLGNSDAVTRLRAQLHLARQTFTHVGLTGPAGSDAMRLAWSIANPTTGVSPSADHVAVALDGSLMDAELLEAYSAQWIDHLRQNPPPARATLLIERIDEMPADAQGRLAQWLTQWPDRLRLIGWGRSLTSEPIPPAVGTCLRTLVIDVPPLAERREDLPDLAVAWVGRCVAKSNASKITAGSVHRSTPPRLSRDAIDAITLYPWPGEIDELRHAIRHAVAATPADTIAREHLPLAIRSYRVAGIDDDAAAANETQNFHIQSLDDEVRNYEKRLIAKAMTAAGGNKADAARRLGISRTRLLRKLDES